MVITEPHYHFATGKSSKNRGNFYQCRKKPTTDILEGCCIYPAYRDSEGKDRIDDTQHELVLMGLLSDNDELTLEQEKQEALDSLCILGTAKPSPPSPLAPLPTSAAIATREEEEKLITKRVQ
jgi:hypothetical protein